MPEAELGLLCPDGTWQDQESLYEPLVFTLSSRRRDPVGYNLTFRAYPDHPGWLEIGPTTCIHSHNLETDTLTVVDGDEGWAVNEETELEFVGVEGDFRWCYQPGSEAAKAAEARRPAKRVQTDSEEESEGEGTPQDKRRRLDAPKESAAPLPTPEERGLLRSPLPAFCLMANRGLPAHFNRGACGARLAQLLGGGNIEWLLVSSYMIDIHFLISHVPAILDAEAVVIVHGERHNDTSKAWMREVAQGRAGWVVHEPRLDDAFGAHHSKAFLAEYKGGLRVIVHTANLIHQDLNLKTQGLWMQDFPRKDEASPMDDASREFEHELRAYLDALGLPPDQARHARELCERHDFSSARVHLIPSVPGRHTGVALHEYGHMLVRKLLGREVFDPALRGAPLVAQFSSLGSIGREWLGELQDSFCAGTCAGDQPGTRDGMMGPPQSFRVVWPTVEEVKNSVEGWFAGVSMPGNVEDVLGCDKGQAQPVLKRHWCKWDGRPEGRANRMPHISTYLRHKREGRLAYMLLASNNLSKAAWGALEKEGGQLHIRQYELGVLLLPSLEQHYRAHRHFGFVCTPNHVRAAAPAARGPISFWAASAGAQHGHTDTDVVLPVPYPLPLQPYVEGVDEPWRTKEAFPGTDSAGLTMQQSHAQTSHYGHQDEAPL